MLEISDTADAVELSLDRMAVGVDFGFEGGIVAVHKDSVVWYSKMPVKMVISIDGESDKKYNSQRDKRVGKGKPERSKLTGELKPKRYKVYDTYRIVDVLEELQVMAVQLGYVGISLAIESPQMFIGRSSPKTYFASGRGQNAWLVACDIASITPVFFNPKHWKTEMGLSDSKEQSVSLANAILTMPSDIATDHDMCEAALLAVFLRQLATRYVKYV